MMRSEKRKAKNEKQKVKNLKLYVLSFSFALCVLRFLLCTAFAQSISSSDLINNSQKYDGKIISYEGEVVGDIMKRGNFAWMNVYDGYNAIGVWIPQELLQEIVHTGSYKSSGDRVKIEGIFNQSCLDHGGDLDIHALNLIKIEEGYLREEELINPQKQQVAIAILGILICLVILRIFVRKP